MEKQCFFTDGPIHTEEHFFGRAIETERILRLLRRDQNVSIVGSGRIGKSSLLHHISKPAVFEAHNLIKTRHRFVYVDCCDLADLDPSQCRAEIVQRAKQEMPEVTFSLPSDAASLAVISEYLRRFFRQVERAGLRCIIMLDHFKSLVDNPRLDCDFPQGLRAMNSMHQVIYMVASTESLSKLEERWLSQRHQTSPFFNIFHNQALGPFSQDESRAFLRQRFASASSSVPNLAVDSILSWARGHPYYLQSAGAFTVSLLSERRGGWNEHLTKRLQDYLADLSESDISQYR